LFDQKHKPVDERSKTLPALKNYVLEKWRESKGCWIEFYVYIIVMGGPALYRVQHWISLALNSDK
jgi:hypothetical protein